MTFERVCNVFLGYNVTFANDIIRLNARSFPEWGNVFNERVTDYLGNTYHVMEPCSLALYPMAKTTNDTHNSENLANMRIAKKNNPEVNTEALMICANGIIDWSEI